MQEENLRKHLTRWTAHKNYVPQFLKQRDINSYYLILFQHFMELIRISPLHLCKYSLSREQVAKIINSDLIYKNSSINIVSEHDFPISTLLCILFRILLHQYASYTVRNVMPTSVLPTPSLVMPTTVLLHHPAFSCLLHYNSC